MESKLKQEIEELKRVKEFEEQKELERKKKLEDEAFQRRRKRQREWFLSPPPPTVLIDFNFIVGIEKLFGDKIIGQKGPVWSIASAIRLRENG